MWQSVNFNSFFLNDVKQKLAEVTDNFWSDGTFN